MECYYCQENGGEEHDICTADEFGHSVTCQTSDPDGEHYGDACAVGHVGKQYKVLKNFPQNVNFELNQKQIVIFEYHKLD